MRKLVVAGLLFFMVQWTYGQCLSGDCINGKGIYHYKNGNVYEGEFRKGKRDGKGVINFENGAQLLGEFKNDVPNGRGILAYRNGAKYFGFFKSGQRSGYGLIYNQEGELQRCGLWAKGKLIANKEEETVLKKIGLNEANSNSSAGKSRLRITKNGVEVVDNRRKTPKVLEPKVKPVVKPVVVAPKKVVVKVYKKPVIAISSPANVASRGFKVVSSKPIPVTPKQSEQVIVGTVEAEGGLKELRVNGRAVPVNGNQFSVSVRLFPGKNEVYFVAVDWKGQASEKIIELVAHGTVDINANTGVTKLNKTPIKQKRLALLIGNSNYTGAGALKNPVNDVREMEAALKNVGFDVMKYEDLDQRGMNKAIDNYGNELQKYDVGLFFYAGHGLQLSGTNYLVPTSSTIENEQDAEYECVLTSKVIAKMEDAKTKVNIVILDACRNNPFEKTWSTKKAGGGLASVSAPMGTFIAYATAPGTTASDGASKNGLYTENVLRYIQSPGLTIEEMFRRVRLGVYKMSNEEQVPWDSSSLTDEFFFK